MSTPTFATVIVSAAPGCTMSLASVFAAAIRQVHPQAQQITYSADEQRGCWITNQEQAVYIILCTREPLRGLLRSGQQLPKHYIVYQLDPAAVLDDEEYLTVLRQAYAVWDHDARNVDILDKLGIRASHLPIAYHPALTAGDLIIGDRLYDDRGKDTDVLFLGNCSYQRRTELRDQLYKQGLWVWFTGEMDTVQMQAAVKRAKICLNVHSHDPNGNKPYLETLRLNLYLSNLAVVVSEYCGVVEPEADRPMVRGTSPTLTLPSTATDSTDAANNTVTDNVTVHNMDGDLRDEQGDTEIIREYAPAVIFSPYQQLVETCVALVKDFNRRRQLAHHSYQWYIKRRWIDQLRTVLSDLPLTTKNGDSTTPA